MTRQTRIQQPLKAETNAQIKYLQSVLDRLEENEPKRMHLFKVDDKAIALDTGKKSFQVMGEHEIDVLLADRETKQAFIDDLNGRASKNICLSMISNMLELG